MSEFVAKMDDLGRPAWIGLMVIGFVLFWPVGLMTLAFLIWSGRMGCGHNGWRRGGPPWARKMGMWQGGDEGGPRFNAGGFQSTGNKAFDDYREATLKRLKEEFDEFQSFLGNLRAAKDKAEFDQFMSERRNGKPSAPPAT